MEQMRSLSNTLPHIKTPPSSVLQIFSDEDAIAGVMYVVNG